MPFENVANLLRSNQTLTWRSAPRCPKCHQVFTSSFVVREGTSRRAFILRCDHLMCERCIQDQLRAVAAAPATSRPEQRTTVVCRVCNIRTILDPSKPVPEQLLHSFHMMGFVYQWQHEQSRLKPTASSFQVAAPGEVTPSGSSVGSVELPDDDKECYECNVTRTRHYCEGCDTPLCRDCFEKIHAVGKALAKHKLCALTAKRWLKEDVSVCQQHQLPTALFCTSCEVRVCATCRNENHALHFCAPLQDINKEAQPRLEKLLQDLQQAVAMNEQGQKFAEQVLEQQKEYTNAAIGEITDYFLSLHSVLQSAEQELLQTVKTNFLKLHTETVEVQKELRVADRNLQRSIEQFQSYQEALPRQTLLSDLIRDMKKMLAKVPVTAQFQEPRENPFRFREREPLRKDIHTYFELNCNPNAYHTKLIPLYEQQPFPVLEPINSPEMVLPEAEGEPPSEQLNRSNRTPKDMDISAHSRSPTPKEQTPDVDGREAARDCLSLGSGGSVDRRIKNTPANDKRKSPKTVPRKDAKSPDVNDENSQRPRGQNNNNFGKSKRALGGRLKSYGSSGSSGHHYQPKPYRSARPTPKTETPALNPANPENATFMKLSDKVSVTFVENPHKFYVQHHKYTTNIKEMCQMDAEDANGELLSHIQVGGLYLAQLPAQDEWHRVKILASRKHGTRYDVFFVDYGRTEEVPRANLRAMSEELKNVPQTAEKCALYDLVPADGGSGKWSPETKQIMVDFIDNKQVWMYLVQQEKSSGGSDLMLVDLIAQTIDTPKSLRNTLLYLKLAKPDPRPRHKRTQETDRKIEQLQTTTSKWVSDYRLGFAQRSLVRDDVFRAKVTYSLSMSEFYVRKNAWQEQYEKLEERLAAYCLKEGKLAYLPHVGMVCAFAEHDADDRTVWKRGRVSKVGEANCEIASVDTGHRLVVQWQDIRYLPQALCQEPAFAVRCALMHVQPFKQHGYRWTDEATRDFNRLANSSSVFEAIVGDRLPEDNCYEVVLNIVRKRHDVCLNALMVKNGFAVSSGEESMTVERNKEKNQGDEESWLPQQASQSQKTEDVSVNRTLGSRSSTSEQQRRQSRVNVSILRLVTPSEFYVTMHKNASGVARMQEEIQNIMDDREPGDKTDWKVGELCLVFPTMASKHPYEENPIVCEYYRARIVEIVDDSNYTVFLIDKAHTMNVHYSNMAVIEAGLKQVHPAAIRCFLACIAPIGNQETWSPSVVDVFKATCRKFKFFSISLHGRSVQDALPVILWGMTAEHAKALSPQFYQYTNINNILVKYGYAHLKEKFQPLSEAASIEEELLRQHESFDQFLQELDVDMKEAQQPKSEENSFALSCDTYKDDITDEFTPIDRWPPAKPIEKNIFVGKPYYVDNNGVIYLHDMEQEPVLKALRKVINDKFANSDAPDKFYSANEPCMAKFHLDNNFYRAIIRKAISCRRYKVQFVDYGNIEEIDITDLRKKVICGRVPIQINRYRLTNVAPKEGNTWPTDVLDTLHSLVVDKLCQVRVDTDMDTDKAGVIPCFIKTTGVVSVDVSEYLLEKDLVVKKRAILEEKIDLLYDPYMNLQGTGREPVGHKAGGLKIGANFGAENVSTESVESHNRVGNFKQEEIDDLLGYVAAEQSRVDNAELEEGEDSGDEFNRVQFFDNIKQEEFGSDLEPGSEDEEQRIDGKSSSNVSFNPHEFDTSTQFEPPLELTRPHEHGYPQFELAESVKGFHCEVTNLADTYNLFVFPQLDEHIQQMKTLMAKIQCHARKNRKCVDIEDEMPCLALYKADNFWYRGVIKDHFKSTGQVEIFYVDYLNKETVNQRDIIKCPVSLRRFPLRNVQIRLHGVRGNPHMRDADIRMKLVELIEGKRMYARVVRHGLIPEVELYTDSKCTSLVYQRLIKEKYFTVNDGCEPTTAAFASVRRHDK